MIRFNHDNVAATEMFAHVLRCVTQIGDERERLGRGEEITIVATGESKTNRFLRVVRHGEALDFEITETKTRAGFEHLPIGAMSESRLNGASGGCVGEDPNVWIFFQSIDATCVIAVLVGEEYGVDSIETFADGFEQGRKFTRRKTDVDEYARALGDQQRRVARTATAENTKAHCHAAMWLKTRSDTTPNKKTAH